MFLNNTEATSFECLDVVSPQNIDQLAHIKVISKSEKKKKKGTSPFQIFS